MEPSHPIPEPQPTDPRLIELMHRYLLGDLAADEFALLERSLLASAESRRGYLQAVRIDAALQIEADHAHAADPAPPTSRRWWQPAAIAAAVVLAALGWWQLTSRETATGLGPAPALAEIATLGDTRDCTWAGATEVEVNQRLAGGMLELTSGVALIEFDGGARLALQGPATLELIDPKTARLHHGRASVRCEEGLYSFSLLTPTSIVIDMGTEFGVAVGGDGASEVHVLDGEVEVTGALNEKRQQNRFLTAGATLLLASDGENEELPESTHEWIRDYTTQADREAATLPPRVIARDPFPSKPGQPHPFALGTGWRDAWWQSTPGRKGAFGFAPLAPLAARDGDPRMAMLVGGWVEVRRFLAEPIDPTAAQTVYLGFSLYRTNPKKQDQAGKRSEATVMFRSSTDPASVLGMALSGRDYLVVLERGGWERSESPVNAARPLFIVAKVEFNPRRGNRVSMISFDQTSPIPPAEPRQWGLVTQRQLARLTAPLDVIALQVRQAPFKFGEITLGNSWEAVTNPAAAGD